MSRYFAAIILAFIFLSCNKEASNEFYPDLNNPFNDTVWLQNIPVEAPVNKIFQTLSISPQTDSFDASVGSTLHFEDGLQIIFPANACGVSGKINVEVDYLKTRGDMIRFAKPTISNGNILESGGAFHISVSQHNLPLNLQSGKFINVRYEVSNPDASMRLFYGDTSSNNFNWIPATSYNDSSVTTWRQEDSSGFREGYSILCQKFSWVNCDKFADTTNPRTTLSATLPVNFTNKNTAVFVVFKNMLSVVQMNADADNRLFYYNNIPVNSDVIIVSISKIGDDLYLGTKQITVTENLVTELSPEKKTEEEISDYLNSL